MDETKLKLFKASHNLSKMILDEDANTAKEMFKSWRLLQDAISFLGLREEYTIWKRGQK